VKKIKTPTILFLFFLSVFSFSASYEQLVLSLSSSNTRDQIHAAIFLQKLAVNSESHYKAFKAGAIPPLATLFKKGQTKEVKDTAFFTLKVLSYYHEEIRKAIYDEGLIPLVSLRLKNKKIEDQLETLEFLSYFAGDSTEVRETLCEKTIMGYLISFGKCSSKKKRSSGSQNFLKRSFKSFSLLRKLSDGDKEIQTLMRREKTHSFMLEQMIEAPTEELKRAAEFVYGNIAPISPEMLEEVPKRVCAIL